MMENLLKLKDQDTGEETGTIELTDDGVVEFDVSNIGYYREGAYYILTKEQKSQLTEMLAPELLAKNKALEARVAELECLILRSSEAALKLQKEITEMRNSMQTLKRITGR